MEGALKEKVGHLDSKKTGFGGEEKG